MRAVDGEDMLFFNAFSVAEIKFIRYSIWETSKISRYFATGGVEGCSELGYIKKELTLPECISALGIHIE